MGSGSRIDHQHHLIAPTAGRTITLVEELTRLSVDETHQELVGRIMRLGQEVGSGTASDEQQEQFAQLRAELREAYGDAAPAQPQADLPSTLSPEVEEREDRTVQRAAAQQVLDETLAEHQEAGRLQVQAREQWPADQDVSYVDDMDAFQRAYEAARDRAARGEEAIPYMLEDATGGLGAREGGRGFGLEIEFDVDGDYDDYAAARIAIARDLHEAGLSRDGFVHQYHSQQDVGYTDAANAWRMETDCTVAGEIVSPILYDEPDTWRNLATICEIVERHGGGASANTGGHVHVGLHDYDHEIGNHQRLMQSYQAYEDVLFRLAQAPGAPGNRHRGVEWCRPNRVPSQGYASLREVRDSAFHGRAVNLNAARGERSDHGEFRLWDGSVNPSVIQTQVKLSLGLVAAAVRQSASGSSQRPPVPLGTHRGQVAAAGLTRRRQGGEAWRNNTLNFRQLVDEVFHRAQDKEQATALFSQTRWQQYR